MRALAIVTGATQGFARAAALAIARTETLGADFLLLSRDRATLADTVAAIAAARPLCRIVRESCDMGVPGEIGRVVDRGLALLPFDTYDLVLLVNSAGTLGRIAPVVELRVEDIMPALLVNVAGCMALTAHVWRRCSQRPAGPPTALRIVNVSTLWALQPASWMGMYCVTRAAREMFHRVVAAEAAGDASGMSVRALSYGPGPMETSAQRELRATPSPQQQMMTELAEQGKLVDCDVSAGHLVRVLLDDTFENGAHIDVYDLMAQAE